MLQNCPKLQTLMILKVCLSHQWIVTGFCLLFSSIQVFLQILFFSVWQWSNSTTKEDWKNRCHVPECVLSHLITCKIDGYKAVKADFRFTTLCRMRDFYRLWPFSVLFTKIQWTAPNFLKIYPIVRGTLSHVSCIFLVPIEVIWLKASTDYKILHTIRCWCWCVVYFINRL
jgi:hypothetical protein